MQTFLQIVASNALLVVVLAAGVTLLGRVWKNPLCLHLLWVFVLLKLVTPPLVTVPVPLPERQAPPAIGGICGEPTVGGSIACRNPGRDGCLRDGRRERRNRCAFATRIVPAESPGSARER